MAICTTCGYTVEEGTSRCPSCRTLRDSSDVAAERARNSAINESPIVTRPAAQRRASRRRQKRWLYVLIPIIVVLGVSGLFFGVTSIIKSTGAYKTATAYVSTNELVIGEIGEVTGFGFMPQGSVSVSGPSGEADISISVKGKSGNGTLYAQLVKELGEWKITRAEFETSSGQRLKLNVQSFNAR